ncbi:MAG: tryptophan tryptophylquinone biosynthesis enzyme MauG [Gammaproteobacteria bacterium]|nr:MAG: tryptophan tryptophylquinone biosynthesis enzyme MauG [Gammaproteobacteria bacterium]
MKLCEIGFSPRYRLALLVFIGLIIVLPIKLQAKEFKDITFEAGHESLQGWLLPKVPHPKGNEITEARVTLGKMLFFDTRLSGDGNMSCGTCHNPLYGWSDGLPTARGFKSEVLGRASPTVINTAFNSLQMWDGRKKSLEEQAMGPMMSNAEMNMNIPKLLKFLNETNGYKKAFNKAYPKETINELTIAKGIASFERTIISNNSPFDQWIKGNKKALTKQQIKGFKLFVNPKKGNCEVCHSGSNFTDNGFHNIGLAQFGKKDADMGRYIQRPLGLMKGAFKTPTLRDITQTAPYFHDGSSLTLEEVVAHYEKGGVAKGNLSPNMKTAKLSKKEQTAIVAFMKSLNTKQQPFLLPIIPH